VFTLRQAQGERAKGHFRSTTVHAEPVEAWADTYSPSIGIRLAAKPLGTGMEISSTPS